MAQREGGGEEEVVATDFHEGVLENLERNVRDNRRLWERSGDEEGSDGTSDGSDQVDSRDDAVEKLRLDLLKLKTTPSSPTPSSSLVKVAKLDWSAVHTSRSFARNTNANTTPSSNTLSMPPPFHLPFSTILAADVVYGPSHASWLKSCAEQFLCKPDSKGEGAEATFHLIVPLRPTHVDAISSIGEVFPRREDLEKREEGGAWRIAVRRCEEVERSRGVGRVDEGGYRRYEIGWC